MSILYRYFKDEGIIDGIDFFTLMNTACNNFFLSPNGKHFPFQSAKKVKVPQGI